MRYYIKVFKLEENEQYVEQMKEWKERNRYGGMNEVMPEREIRQPALETILTEKEFDEIRKACIAVM